MTGRLREAGLETCLYVSLFALFAVVVTAAQGGPYERQKIDPAAAKRGRGVYARQCINCHGSTAKGTERGPDLIRSALVLRDRLGSGIGPAAQNGPSHQTKLSAAEIVDLSHFLHERIELTATNRTARVPLNVLTGDPEAGRAFFNGAGRCSTCHSPTGDLAGIATRIPDGVNLQQRWLFPTIRRGGDKQVQATVTVDGRVVSGTLIRQDDFTVALRDATGDYQSFTRGAGVTVVVTDPLSAHYELLDRYTDTDMHNITTYLATLR
jgi:mono/diheme cytochrome c family protein